MITCPNEASSIDLTGILLLNKPKNRTSFSLISQLRRLLNIKKIGHAGTLDPFATGVMVMLIGKEYTRLSDAFLSSDKEYLATIFLGIETDTHDCDGEIIQRSALIPSLEHVKEALKSFQGEIKQIPPMFSAKKQNGKKLYELARKGITVERPACIVTVETTLLHYTYPHLQLHIRCSKGTYIRSIASDLGKSLGCGAHLIALERTRSGSFHLQNCLDATLLSQPNCDLKALCQRLIKKDEIL